MADNTWHLPKPKTIPMDDSLSEFLYKGFLQAKHEAEEEAARLGATITGYSSEVIKDGEDWNVVFTFTYKYPKDDD